MTDDHAAGGLGENPSRSDMALIRQALRQDWPIPPEVKRQILQRLVNYVDPDSEDSAGRPLPPRTVIAAARVLAAFGGLSLKQALLDLHARKLDGSGAKNALDIVREAERLALAAEADPDPEPEPEPTDRDRSRGPPV